MDKKTSQSRYSCSQDLVPLVPLLYDWAGAEVQPIVDHITRVCHTQANSNNTPTWELWHQEKNVMLKLWHSSEAAKTSFKHFMDSFYEVRVDTEYIASCTRAKKKSHKNGEEHTEKKLFLKPLKWDKFQSLSRSDSLLGERICRPSKDIALQQGCSSSDAVAVMQQQRCTHNDAQEQKQQ
jgi:hypothetical protein